MPHDRSTFRDPQRVRGRKSHSEQIWSALPQIADIDSSCKDFSVGPTRDIPRGAYACEHHPNRFHAACRETASASPIVAQLTSRSRRMSAISCIAVPILSKAPLYPAKVFNNTSVGALSGHSEGTSCVVGLCFFAMMGRQRCTHSSQMKTPGPATSVLTSVCAFPQNEQ
jgi:hypothetical protein